MREYGCYALDSGIKYFPIYITSLLDELLKYKPQHRQKEQHGHDETEARQPAVLQVKSIHHVCPFTYLALNKNNLKSRIKAGTSKIRPATKDTTRALPIARLVTLLDRVK
jgi:hypothetical protein